MKADKSVETEWSLGNLSCLSNCKQTCRLWLNVNQWVMLKFGCINNLWEWKHVLNIIWDCLSAHQVKVWSSCDFFCCDTTELRVLQIHSHFIVNIWPLRNQINLLAVVCVPLKEICCLMEIRKNVVLCKCTWLSGLPAWQLGESLGGWNLFACANSFQIIS